MKWAAVVGGTRGIGRAIATRLADTHDMVWVTGRSSGVTPSEDESHGAIVHASCDSADAAALRDLIGKTIERHGAPRTVFVNAGITRDGALGSMTDGDWNEVIDVNLRGAFVAARGFLPAMVGTEGASMTFISSVAGVSGMPGQCNYSASKAGVCGMMRSIALEYAPRGVRINAISPGYIETAMTEGLSTAIRRRAIKTIPIGRMGQVDDVAALASFLASDEAAYITGQNFLVDGGLAA